MLSRFSFHQQRRDKHPHTHPFAHFSTCEFLTLNSAEQDCCKEGAGSSNLTTLPFRKPITHVQSIACGPHTAPESCKQGPGKNYKLFFKHHEFCFAFYNSFFKNWIAPVTSMNFTDDNIVLQGQKVSLPWPYTTACVRNQTLSTCRPTQLPAWVLSAFGNEHKALNSGSRWHCWDHEWTQRAMRLFIYHWLFPSELPVRVLCPCGQWNISSFS